MRMSEIKQVRSTCSYCGTGCGLILEVEDNKIIKVRGDKDAPINKGQTCVKGAFAYNYVHANERLHTPLIRKNGQLVETTWEEAYQYITDNLNKVKKESGPSAISMFACARASNEVNYVTQKFMRTAIGSNNIDGCNRTCHAASVAGLATVYGNGAPTNSIDDYDEADFLLLIGTNPTESYPIIGNRIKKAAKNGLRIHVIDPRNIDMVKVAEKHLQIKVGTDIALINAMIHVILEEKLYSPEFVNKASIDLDNLTKMVEKYTPEYAASIVGITAEEIIETARAYANAENAMITYSLGITEHHCGVNNVFDIANLALLTGHIGKKGNGIMPLRGQNNVQGAGDMGCLPNQLPGGVFITNDAYRARFNEAWNVTINPISGDTQTRTFDRIDSGDVRALYIIGENPLIADVHMTHTRHLLEKLDLLVVQDIFLTETAELADVVLPARSWAEVEGTFTNTDRRVQRVRTAVEAHPNTKDDWRILAEVSTLMGYPMHYDSSEEIWNEMRSLAHELYGGMSYERLDIAGLQYPCPTEDHPGTFVLHEDLHSETPERKAPFIAVDYSAPIELPDEDYPFMLTTGRRYESYNTNSQTRHYAPGVKLKQTEETADIHPEDAEKLGIENGDLVEVSSRRGKLQVKAKVTEQVVPGLVFMSFHWSETPTNILTINEFDPISGTAEFKACAIQIKAV